jgi:hypothetical protein
VDWSGVSDINSATVTPASIFADVSDEGATLSTTLNPAYKRTITYTSGNTGIVTVAADGNLTYVGTGSTSISVAVGGLAETKTVPVKILKSELTNGTSYVYGGSAVTPAVQVTCGSTLNQGTDYTVQYNNNTSVGEASVTITGAGAYSGYQKTLTYQITASNAITQDMVSDATFSVNTTTNAVTVERGMSNLVCGTD